MMFFLWVLWLLLSEVLVRDCPCSTLRRVYSPSTLRRDSVWGGVILHERAHDLNGPHSIGWLVSCVLGRKTPRPSSGDRLAVGFIALRDCAIRSGRLTYYAFTNAFRSRPGPHRLHAHINTVSPQARRVQEPGGRIAAVNRQRLRPMLYPYVDMIRAPGCVSDKSARVFARPAAFSTKVPGISHGRRRNVAGALQPVVR